MFNQDDRTCTAFWQAYLLQEQRARGVLTCAKAKNVMSIKSQQEIDPSVTECALSIEDYDCLAGASHVLILTRKPFTQRAASRSWHADGYRRYFEDDRGQCVPESLPEAEKLPVALFPKGKFGRGITSSALTKIGSQ